MGANRKKYAIEQCALYNLTTKRRLEEKLLLQSGELKGVMRGVTYRDFQIPKKSGSFRQVSEPNKRLKLVQKRVLWLLSAVEKPDWVMSATPGKCHKDNAVFHRSNAYMVTMDIESFYDKCERERVYQFFKRKLRQPGDVAKALTDLSTYRQSIPTGAPTSQIVAYFAYESMFAEINQVAKSHGCIFTLYVDDMTFSSGEPFSPDKLASEVDAVLRKYGHKSKMSKTRYYPQGTCKLTTGAAISRQLLLVAPNDLRKRVLENYDKLRKTGDKSLVAVILGQIGAAEFIEGRDMFPGIKQAVRAFGNAS